MMKVKFEVMAPDFTQGIKEQIAMAIEPYGWKILFTQADPIGPVQGTIPGWAKIPVARREYR